MALPRKTYPTPGASRDVWGTMGNAVFDDLYARLEALEAQAGAPLPTPTPNTPSAPVASAGAAGTFTDTTITISGIGAPSSDGGSPITGYRIFASGPGAFTPEYQTATFAPADLPASFPLTNFQPDTTYTVGVFAINANGPGARRQFTVKTLAAATGGGGGSTAYPAKEIAVYNMSFSNSPAPLSNLVALTKVNVVRLAFGNTGGTNATGTVTLVGYGPEGKSAYLASLSNLRSRGAKIILSLGGGGYPVDLSNTSARVSQIAAIAADIGGLDGVDIDIENNTITTAQCVALAKALKVQFGAAFAISMVPNGTRVNEHIPIAVALHQATQGGVSCLDSFGQQFYDATVTLSDAQGRINQMITAGIPVSKIAVGMMIGTDTSQYWTQAQCKSYMQSLMSLFPGLQRAYLWEQSRAGTSQWVTDMAGLLGV